MELFKRFPSFHPFPHEEVHFIPLEERNQVSAFTQDFLILERELMPYFRLLDREAVRRQNWYRWMYILLIFGSPLVTILGILQLAFLDLEWIGITTAILAAILAAVTTASHAFRHQEHYLNARLAAEQLRGEYFLFLGQLEPYTDGQDRLQQLRRRVADIKVKGGVP